MNIPAGWELLDLHNHTQRSYDAHNTLEDYEQAHAVCRFDVLAITEHNRIDGARELAAAASFDVIVGQEVDTNDGELIGLFLNAELERGHPIEETAHAIRAQGGLVYLPHPFFRLVRNPVSAPARERLAGSRLIDIVEVANGGPFTADANDTARRWAQEHGLPMAAGSDAHEPGDIGTCVCAVPPGPLSAHSLPERLREGRVITRRRANAAKLAAKARTRAQLALDSLRGGPRKRR
jgi:predicted metal-dependent phosphoesterase TrpH